MDSIICPHCKNTINDDDALRCLYCGELLNRQVGFLSKIRYSAPGIAFTIVIALIFIYFIAYMYR